MTIPGLSGTQLGERPQNVERRGFLERVSVMGAAISAVFLGVPVVRPKISETTALGAAYLAGLAVGYWQNQSEIAEQWRADRKFIAAMKPAARKKLCAGWAKALTRAKAWEV